MTCHSHSRTRKKIRRLFIAGLSGSDTAHLWKSLYTCPSCARMYEQFSTLERELLRNSVMPSVFSIERVGNAVLQQHAGENRHDYGKVQARLRNYMYRVRWAIGATVLLGTLIVIGLGLSGENKSHRVSLSQYESASFTELSARGMSRAAVSYVGIRVFAVTPSHGVLKEERALRINDVITFTYTYAQNRQGYLMLFGLQEGSDRLLWYYPDMGRQQSIQIQGVKVDEPLGDGVKLSVNHQPGPLRIVSLFSSTPLQVSDVTHAVERMRQRGHLMDVDNALPLDSIRTNVIMYSLLLYIENGDITDDSH